MHVQHPKYIMPSWSLRRVRNWRLVCSELHFDTDFEIYGSSIGVCHILYFIQVVGMRKDRAKNNAKMKKKDGQTDRQTDRQTERNKERKTDRQTDRKTERQKERATTRNKQIKKDRENIRKK